ncbi:MAG TPA: alpha/beta hydrolase-fold protein [Candidatus Binatia bacterium]|nr:alpha/beta hydrolase-fold protein [Candidatus Binatia bacterium]
MCLVRRAFAATLILLGLFVTRADAARPTAASLRVLTHTSDLLSQFWGAPVDMQAAVYVPPRCRRQNVRCGVLYHLPGYGGSIADAWTTVQDYVRLSARVPKLAMAHVFLDPSVNGGYSYFTDSENNGPWDSALTQEFIPYVEALLGVGGSAQKRFLEGHSSGGWTVMWLQVSNPDFFRAVWAIAPDPLDFRHFYQIDVTPGSTDNFYSEPDGTLRYLTRQRGITIEDLMQNVDDDPAQGGIISSYEFAWSPRGADGLPLRFFDRSDGSLIEETLEAWQAYDVEAVMDRGGVPLRDALSGKVHIYCGAKDDFFYNEPTSEMCQFLQRGNYRAVCRIVPGRTHGSVFNPTSSYPLGLRHLVLSQAATLSRATAR